MKDGDIKYVILFELKGKHYIKFAYSDEERDSIIAAEKTNGSTLIKYYNRLEGGVK